MATDPISEPTPTPVVTPSIAEQDAAILETLTADPVVQQEIDAEGFLKLAAELAHLRTLFVYDELVPIKS